MCVCVCVSACVRACLRACVCVWPRSKVYFLTFNLAPYAICFLKINLMFFISIPLSTIFLHLFEYAYDNNLAGVY